MKYATIDAMWAGCLNRALRRGQRIRVREMNCREITAYQATLTNVHQNFLLNKRRRLSTSYASAEMLWYLSGENSTEMIEAYAPQYHNFAENGIAHGAYGHRWLYDHTNETQIGAAIELLEKDPTTRQCVISMWKSTDLLFAIVGNKKDLPCTMTWQFMIRNNQLHMICTMRSCDVWLGYPYDVYVNTTIQKLVAMALGVRSGTYTHQVGSLHVYEKNVTAARETTRLLTPHFKEHTAPLSLDLLQQAKIAVQCERDARKTGEYDTSGLCDILADAVNLCAKKWCKPRKIISPLMREAACLS